MIRKPLTRALSVALSLALVLASALAAAQPAPDEAKRHFLNGVHLSEDRNFAGALVEFEASFQLNPTAAALQNMAVCQKGLFRYADAIASLQRMLKDFSLQLSGEDKQAAQDAIREMSALLGTLVLRVTPKDAKITLNDAPVPPETAKAPLRLPAGEYRIAAEAPGYARMENTVSVVSGSAEKVVTLNLLQQTGTLAIHASDSQAAIAIDGVQVGYDDWKGTVPAGPHEVFVYTSTLRHRVTVMVLPAQNTEFDIKLSQKDAAPPATAAAAGPTPPPYVPPPPQRGFYGFLSLRIDRLNVGELNVNAATKAAQTITGGFLGLQAGYRLSTSWGTELTLSQGTHNLNVCAQATNCPAEPLTTTRFGANLRLMTLARKYRFFATTGFGLAAHKLSLDTLGNAVKEEKGSGAYFTIGGGLELNLGHFLLDAILDATTESANNLSLGRALTSGGLELRVGYGQW
jgi:hypothetical protein